MAEEFKYKHSYDLNDKITELLAIALLIQNAYLIIEALLILPTTIPNHFNLNGEPNGYGSKYTVLGPFIFSILLYIVFGLLVRSPAFYNSRMSKSNKPEEYRLTVKMIITLKPVLILVFLIISYFMVETAQLKLNSQIKLVVPLVLIPIFSHIVYWIFRFSKIK